MKILLPYDLRGGRKFEDPIITGGIEKFCNSIYENFDDVKVVEIPNSSKLSSKDRIYYSILIKNSAEDYGADIIISNWTQAAFAGANMVNSQIPLMVVCHHHPSVSSVIGKFSRINENKHSLFFVSPYQKNLFDKMAKRIKLPPIIFDGYLNSGFVSGDKPKLVEPEWDCGTIGRCNTLKKPFILKELTKDTDLKTLVITNSWNADHADYPYQKRNKHWDDVLWDAPYNEVMDHISRCRTYFSTWNQETWGITALEALSCGLPIILNCDKDGDHASETLPADASHFVKIPDRDGDALINAIKSFENVDRKEIQEMTWEKHNLERWKSLMEDAINKTIDKFKINLSLREFMI